MVYGPTNLVANGLWSYKIIKFPSILEDKIENQ